MRDAYLQRRQYLINDGKTAESLPEENKTEETSGNTTETTNTEAFPGEEGNQKIAQ